MTEPLPFQPYWVAFRGGVRSEGRGLLTGARDTVEKFVVHCGNFTISVLPKEGEICTDSLCIIKRSPGQLVWKRRMQFQLATRDTNHRGMSSCLHYTIGIQNGVGAYGYKLFEDGRILEGAD